MLGGNVISRKDDIAIVICQNNSDKTLIIKTVNDPDNLLEKTLQYTLNTLEGRNLKELLPKYIQQQIDDYLEFDDLGNDLANVLSKTRDFSMISSSSEEVRLNMRIQRDASPDGNPHFVMLVQGLSKSHPRSNLRILQLLKENAPKNEITTLDAKEWFLEEADIVHYYVSRGRINSGFAVIALDDFENLANLYGEETKSSLLKEVEKRCEQTFRKADILGYLGEGKFAVVLVGTDARGAQVPLNRLRWQMANQELFLTENHSSTASLSIAYKEVAKNDALEKTIDNCTKILEKNKGQNNQLLMSA